MTDSAGDFSPDEIVVDENGSRDDEPYVHERSVGEIAARAADSAYGAATRWWADVGDQLRAHAASHGLEPESPLIRELALAASYALRTATDMKGGCALRPLADYEGYAWPPRIAEVGPEIVTLWRDVADRVQHPAARARFNDLLFERRDGAGGLRAVAAITGYLEAARSRPQADLDIAQFLVRAWDLAQRVRDWRLVADASAELVKHSEVELSRSQPRAGVFFPMLAAVAARPSARQRVQAPLSIPDPAIVGRLLETAFAIAKEGFQTSLIAAMMRVRATDPAEIDQINRREVAAYRAQAAKHAGMARQSRLEDAIRIARDRGLTDLVRQLTSELQAIPVKDLGLKELSWSVRLPPHQVELFLDGFVAGANWREGLHFFLQTDCPTGDLDRLRQELRDNAAHTTFLNVVGRTIVGKGGLPRYTGTSDDDRRAAAEADHARIRADIQGQILAEGLLRMPGRYGIPDESQIAAFLSNDGKSDEALALSLARGFRHYWHGDYEACVHVVTPKIEAAARALLRNLDEGIYRVQVAKDPGQYPGLHVLLQELEKLGLEEAWAFFLRWLLLGPYGMNIRNELAHGFVTDTGPAYAALVLRAAALLITIAGPQPPAVVIETAHADDRPVDLVPLPQRDRDDLLRLLATPVPDPIPIPWRNGIGGRLAAFAASAMRVMATGLNRVAKRLDP